MKIWPGFFKDSEKSSSHFFKNLRILEEFGWGMEEVLSYSYNSNMTNFSEFNNVN